MRLIKYLNEESIEQIHQMLKKDCSQYLNILNKSDGLGLFRGIKDKLSSDIKKITPRKNRKPRDTPKLLHNLLDNLFKDKFGWRARSEAVFVATMAQAQYYGTPYAFFPFDGYKYIWSNQINDLYDELEELDLISSKGITIDLNNKDNINMIKNKLINKYTNKGLKKLLDMTATTSTEAMFKCKAYYLVDVSKWTQIQYTM